MRIAILTLALALLVGSAARLVADFFPSPAETPKGMWLSGAYLQDDYWSVARFQLRMASAGTDSSARVFSRVLDRDASSAYRWTDLAEVLQDAPDGRGAEYCYLRAEELAPYDPQILYAVGDFYGRQGNARGAVNRFARLLALMGAPDKDIPTQNVFNYYERLRIRKSGLLEEAVPDALNARAYLRFLMQSGNIADTEALWRWMQGKKFVDEPLTLQYSEFLIKKSRYDVAYRVWTDGFSARNDGYSRATPMFNGGFEYELTGGVADWRLDGVQGEKAARDSASWFDGGHSLRIDFTGNDNPDFHHIQERVFVQPGMYRLEGHVRTSNVTSDQGIRLRLLGQDGKLLAETDALTGTNDWKRLDAVVEVPPATSMVTVQIARRRSIRIDNQLTGTAWVDAVKLTRAE